MNADTAITKRGILGRTGLEVCRLGISSSYGVSGDVLERAFERGVNYIYWGSRRLASFGEGLKRLKPQRERFVLVIQSYTRMAGLMAWSLERALRTLTFDHADVLLLGMWNKPVTPRILDAARELKQRGLVRFLAVSTHHRDMAPQIAAGTISTSCTSATTPRIRVRSRTSSRSSHLQSSRHGGIHCDKLGPAPGQVEAPAGSRLWGASDSQERARAHGDGLLSICAQPPRSGCVHDGALQCRADGGRAASFGTGTHDERRAGLDAPRGHGCGGKVGYSAGYGPAAPRGNRQLFLDGNYLACMGGALVAWAASSSDGQSSK